MVDLRQPCSLDLVCGLPISRLGLIDKVLAPASVKERPVPQWQRQKAKGKVERINPNCQRKDCRSIRRSFCLGGALAFGHGVFGSEPATIIWKSEALAHPREVPRNDRILRTVPNGWSPEVRRETGISEKNRATLPVGSPELELEMARTTGLNCQRTRLENTRLWESWRRERNWGRTFSA